MKSDYVDNARWIAPLDSLHHLAVFTAIVVVVRIAIEWTLACDTFPHVEAVLDDLHGTSLCSVAPLPSH